jgi:hypothetical protein
MAYKFSQQQIIGLNHHYFRIAEGSFDEDNIRLILIHLREFLQNPDNKGAKGRANATLLKELGDGIAHSVRTEGNSLQNYRDSAAARKKRQDRG